MTLKRLIPSETFKILSLLQMNRNLIEKTQTLAVTKMINCVKITRFLQKEKMSNFKIIVLGKKVTVINSNLIKNSLSLPKIVPNPYKSKIYS